MALINRISRLFKADFHQQVGDARQRRAHDQHALNERSSELESASVDFGAQLDLCFESDKDDLARGLIRKRLEAERLLKRLNARHAANEAYLEGQRALFEENQATLESLRQKAELFASRRPEFSAGDSEFDDISWMAREMTVGDDEVEIVFLREKSARSTS